MQQARSAFPLTKKAHMIIRALILASIVVSSRPLVARDSTDVIVLNNGDRLTCKIERLESGVLYVGVDYVNGDLSIDWRKVPRIESKQLFIVKTQDGSVFTGTLKTAVKLNAEQPTELEITQKAGAEKPGSIEISQIVDVRQTAENSLNRWRGNISAGSAYSKGNNATNTTSVSRRYTNRNAGPRRQT